MKNSCKKVFYALLALVLFIPVGVFANFNEGDSTLFMRVDGGNGCYRVDAAGDTDTFCGTVRLFFAGGTEVTLTAIPNDGYHFTGWYHFDEVDSDGQGTMAYPLTTEVATGDSYTFTVEQNGFQNLSPTFAVNTGTKSIDYALTLDKGGNYPDVVSEDVDVAALISEKRSDFVNAINAFCSEKSNVVVPNYDSLFTSEKYAIVTEIGFYSVDYELSDDAIVLGDMDDFNSIQVAQGTVVRHEVYVIHYDEVTVEQNVSGPSRVITRVDLGVELPSVGDVITLTDINGKKRQTPQAEVFLPEDAHYVLNGDDDNNYMYYYMKTEAHEFFEGTFEKDHTYLLNVLLSTEEGYHFEDGLEVCVNGDSARLIDYVNGDYIEIEYDFIPTPEKKQYEVESSDGAAIALFKFPEGFNFELNFDDILAHTPEEIEATYGVPADYISQAVEQVKNTVKEYGDLVSLYAITVDDPGLGYSEALTLKVKMTDEMKKYNHFQFIFLDENNNFVVEEAFDVSIDGDYLVVELPHLSAYALVGKYVPPAEGSTNPLTGDRIVFYITMLGLCTMGLLDAGFYTKKKYFHKSIKQD